MNCVRYQRSKVGHASKSMTSLAIDSAVWHSEPVYEELCPAAMKMVHGSHHVCKLHVFFKNGRRSNQRKCSWRPWASYQGSGQNSSRKQHVPNKQCECVCWKNIMCLTGHFYSKMLSSAACKASDDFLKMIFWPLKYVTKGHVHQIMHSRYGNQTCLSEWGLVKTKQHPTGAKNDFNTSTHEELVIYVLDEMSHNFV